MPGLQRALSAVSAPRLHGGLMVLVGTLWPLNLAVPIWYRPRHETGTTERETR
jgi:hypothetical protein